MRKFFYFEKVESTSVIETYRSKSAHGCAMPDTYLNGRPVYIDDCHLDGVDSYITEATYADTLEGLSDDDLDNLTELSGDYLVVQNMERFGWFKK